MTMKKVFIVLFLACLAFMIYLFVSDYSDNNEPVAKDTTAEQNKYSKICDTITTVEGQPFLLFADFKLSEYKDLKFQILRNKKLIEDTLLKNNYSPDRLYRLKIPYKRFYKTDTIIVTTSNNLKFSLSGFHHEALLEYGQFENVINHQCYVSETYTINKSVTKGKISRYLIELPSSKNKRLKFVNTDSEEFKNLNQKLKINLNTAQKIFKENKKNKKFESEILCGIEILKNGSNYIFEEETENGDHFETVIINTESGEFKRYSNYPFN
jgi:hypothetical protein